MIGRPERSEAAEYHFSYIDQVPSDDVLAFLGTQESELLEYLASIGEERSLWRYDPGKWSFREALSHINDTERVFSFRALWLARGSAPTLPGFEQEVFVANAGADSRSWASHIEEFRAIRASTRLLLRSFPSDAWMRTGTVSGHTVTTRTLAFMIAGHVEHHRRIFRERYA
jgi:hypothetical protein